MNRFLGNSTIVVALGFALLPGCSREIPVARNDGESKNQPKTTTIAPKPVPSATAPATVIPVGPAATKPGFISTAVNGGHTKAKYESVKKDMTRTQVEAALGKGTVISIDEAARLVTLGGIERSLLMGLTFVRWGMHQDPTRIDSVVVGFSEDGKVRCRGYRSQDDVRGDGAFEPLYQFIKLGGVVRCLD